MLVGKKVGPFVVDKELGSGAMGSVYRGRHEESGQKVAIKVVAVALSGNDTALKRFKRETTILKQLDHPNIVKLLASGKLQGAPFYVMEFVQGESLDKVMERRGRISWEELIPLGQQLCAALQHAHDKGIIHRDLKPANLMMLQDGTVKLADFGIAKDIDVTALTAANSTVGTAAYMSPEQCRGSKEITPKSDLYSMGAMFFELITGRKPFQAETIMEMFMQHTQGKFPRPSRLVMDIPVWLDNIICQLLEKKPDDRPFNADAVAQSLGQVKEKWEQQQSAALVASKRRRADRSAQDIALDETDKEMARTLLGKKKKKKVEPIYRQTWFTLGAVALVLIGLGALVWYAFLRTPSADYLFAQAEKTMKAGTDIEKRDALTEFLQSYPSGPQASMIRTWLDQVDRDKCERQILLRRQGRFDAVGDEVIAFAALTDEDEGRLADARDEWKKLLKHESSSDTELHAYYLVAKSYLRGLDMVDARYVELKKRVEGEKNAKVPAEGTSAEETRALEAVRYEFAGAEKRKAAAFEWGELKNKATQNKDEARKDEMRVWRLLAAHRIYQLARLESKSTGGAKEKD